MADCPCCAAVPLSTGNRRVDPSRHSYGRPDIRRSGWITTIGGGVSTRSVCISGNPAYCFHPAAGENGKPPQIRILVEGPAFAIPTTLVALDHGRGLDTCDRLNRRLGHYDRESWTAFARRCLRASAMNGSTLH